MFIGIIRLNTTELKKWCLGLKPLLRRKRKEHYDELIKAAWHNTADLRAQYLGPKSLIKEKGAIMNLRVLFGTIIQTRANDT